MQTMQATQTPDAKSNATPSSKKSAQGADVVAAELDSAQLLGAQRALRIRHQGALYTLRVTRQDKLILTK